MSRGGVCLDEVTGLPDMPDDLDKDSDSKELSDSYDGFIELPESDAGSDDVKVVPDLVKHDSGDLVDL